MFLTSTLADESSLGMSSVNTSSAVARKRSDGRNDSSDSFHARISEPAAEMDVLVQLRTNLMHLDELHGRMKFMMGELSYLLTKRS